VKLQEKTEVVAALRERLERAQIMILARPHGLSVAEATDLRRAIRACAGEYKVAKNTLTRRAFGETAYASLLPLLEGPTALVFGYEDPVAVAKALVGYAKKAQEKLQIRGAVLEGSVLDTAEVGALAELASLEQLRATLLGVLQAPAQRLVRVLAEPGASLARVLARREESLPSAEG